MSVECKSLDEVRASPLQLSEAQRREQISGKVRATCEAFYTPEMRRRRTSERPGAAGTLRDP